MSLPIRRAQAFRAPARLPAVDECAPPDLPDLRAGLPERCRTWEYPLNPYENEELRVGDMIGVVLIGILALVVGGCVCVVWADRGGPRWTRAVAAATVGAGRAVRSYQKAQRRKSNNGSDTLGGDAG
ncbi:hypothetical protein [Kitasatospora purpeofusca]|uniref:hypothetical protein n=1 Tax=Kitasatospora purpeofusca TaxID=67352 RepID=UPI0036531525